MVFVDYYLTLSLKAVMHFEEQNTIKIFLKLRGYVKYFLREELVANLIAFSGFFGSDCGRVPLRHLRKLTRCRSVMFLSIS